MSPHVANQFTGHLPEGDPRTQCHGAGGCTWPSMPAMRYQLKSTNATRAFTIWNVTPGLIIRNSNDVDHDLWWLSGVSIPPPFSIYLAQKVYTPDTWGYQWQINIYMDPYPLPIEYRVDRPFENCNRSIVLGAKGMPGMPWLGTLGSTFTMYQVHYDKTVPPEDVVD